MTAIRRLLLLSGLTMAVVISTGVPASATFTDTSVVAHTVSTGTVAPPTSVTVDDSCVTATTTTRRTVRTDPVTLVQTQTAYSSTTTYAASSSNVQGTTSSPAPGPGVNETTTTTVTKNTALNVTVTWTASGTRGVDGYVVSAHLGINDSLSPMLVTTATTTTRQVDADYLAYQPSVIVSTHTSYGWTADAARTAVLTC
jgi:hypothetical protein